VLDGAAKVTNGRHTRRMACMPARHAVPVAEAVHPTLTKQLSPHLLHPQPRAVKRTSMTRYHSSAPPFSAGRCFAVCLGGAKTNADKKAGTQILLSQRLAFTTTSKLKLTALRSAWMKGTLVKAFNTNSNTCIAKSSKTSNLRRRLLITKNGPC